ncbi:MAG: LLM class flavin-dependent oxidoreductase [Actinomycetota bacterium]
MVSLGVCFDRTFPAGEVIPWARDVEAAGLDDLWVIEDCFFTAGVSLAAAALATTDELHVGLGILPAVARNPAITAMEIATLAGIAPGRLLAGIGHGVGSWMAQMGAATPSPLTTLDEVISTVRRLLRGEEVTFQGREVSLDAVRLDAPPDPVPPVLAGVRGPRSLALAGRVADGLVLAELAGPTYVRWARELAAGAPITAVFVATSLDDDRTVARRRIAPFLVEVLTESNVAIEMAPGHDDAVAAAAEGPDALLDLPDAWWREVGAIGDPDDVVAHVAALAAAGADRVAFFPPPVLDAAKELVGSLGELAPALRAAGAAPAG